MKKKNPKFSGFAPRSIPVVRAEAWWVEQAQKSLYHYIWYVSDKKPPKHMITWIKALLSGQRTNIIAPRESAKAQPLDAKVLTPTGWKRMGDIHVGDQVIAGDGTATTVTGVFPQGIKPSYHITMSDGSSTESCGEHLWKVRTDTADRWEVVNLNHIRTTLHGINAENADTGYKPWLTDRANRGPKNYRGESRYKIPVTPPVEYTMSTALPIDPYLLGCLLGDGCFTGTSVDFATKDREMIDSLTPLLPTGLSFRHKSRYNWRITSGIRGAGYRNPLMSALSYLGLVSADSYSKFIPNEYLFASVPDRLALLQGLLDTDGTIGKTSNSISLSTSSPKLKDCVVELARSLGMTPKVSEKIPTYVYKGSQRVGKTSYNISFRFIGGMEPFRLTRKAELFAKYIDLKKPQYRPTRGIVGIEYVGDKEMQCIMVDHPDHTYVTDDYIVTHNTTFAVYALTWLIGKSPFATHFIGSVSAKQAEDRLEMAREIIETNLRFKNVFPFIEIDTKRNSNKSEFTVWSTLDGKHDYPFYRSQVSYHGDQKNPTVYACGVGSSTIIGRRISGLCLIDDVHSEANSATPALRQKVLDWFNRTLLPCVKSTGRVLVICTRWGLDDHSGRLKELKNSAGEYIWNTVDIPAIDADGNSYWPELFPISVLDAKRDEYGPIMFGLMYMNDPTTLSTGQWTRDMFLHGLPDPLPDDLSVVISTDLAFTTKTASDYCVFAAVGKAKNPYNSRLNDLFLLNLQREKYKFHDAIDALINFIHMVNQVYPVQAVLFENQAMTLNSYQEFVSRESGYKSKLINVPGDKGTRLSELALKAQRGGFYIEQSLPTLPIIQSEFIGYPRTDHDDTIDAIGLPIWFWNATERSSGIKTITIKDVPELPKILSL